jgi:hypothetical protein
MATVNAQSVEDFADRIIYRFPGGRFEQAPVTWKDTMTPGLKTLVNTDTNRQYVVPASGIGAKFYKIEWFFSAFVVFVNDATAGAGQEMMTNIGFVRINAGNLNYDGKPQQTEFYTEKIENYYTSPQLRSINIANIQMEPKINAIDAASTGTWTTNYQAVASVSYLGVIAQPTVTFYKK